MAKSGGWHMPTILILGEDRKIRGSRAAWAIRDPVQKQQKNSLSVRTCQAKSRMWKTPRDKHNLASSTYTVHV